MDNALPTEIGNLLVEIFVPVEKGGLVGAGFPIWKDRILTARGLLFPSNAAGPIMVRWHNREGAAREWRPIKGVSWDGADAFDVAIIDCRFPEGTQDYRMVSGRRPTSGSPWKSAGFADAGEKDDKARSPVAKWGGILREDGTAPSVKLGAQYAADLPDAWRGSSGSPVFVADRRQKAPACGCDRADCWYDDVSCGAA